MLGTFQESIEGLADPRQPSNGRLYSLSDLVLGAFSAFYLQSNSFLEYQRHLESREGRNNAQSLFGLTEIPSLEQIRNVLDQIAATGLFGVFDRIYQALEQQGYLKSFETLGSTLLVALDGTEYYSSQSISCPCCSKRTSRKEQVTYSHKAILPVIVAPRQSAVISLSPAFITPQDSHAKQDCEQAAAKRWIGDHQSMATARSVTLLGDDLFSRQPMCEVAIANGFNYIFVCLPESHPALYDWIAFNADHGKVKTLQRTVATGKTDEIWHYRYLNDVPLRAEAPSLSVNWCELTVTRKSDGHRLYRNSWVTNHTLSGQRVIEVAEAGRCRWKTENENHNVLKTKGYNLEHNFGHGKEHLSTVLLTLNLLAFLFHTVLALADERYQMIRQIRGTRQGFFQDILALTKYLWFESWTALLDFMLADATPKPSKKRQKPRRNTS
ncbi:MAG: ISNCY family transposase [Cyanobacteria bacterium P01_F01_bin.86]